MNFLRKFSSAIAKHMAVIAVAVTFLSLFVPQSSLWIRTEWINPLLMVIMFGMGLTLDYRDFASAFTKPKYIILGCLAQFSIMPALAYVLSRTFSLDAALTAGVVLVGTCPGGTASNVITYLAGGDVALSVAMTSVNTLLAPVLTPAITYILLRQTVSVDVVSMFVSIVQIVIIPIVLGFACRKLFAQAAQIFAEFMPAVSVAAICMVLACVVSHNSARILAAGVLVLSVVVLHNVLGYLCGFCLGKILGLDAAKIKALSIEIGMQNSGLAVSLAVTAFPALAMASVPGAVFSAWHNISGAMLASVYRRWKA